MATDSMKYFCEECENYFDEDDLVEEREYHGEIDGNFYEREYVCPVCRSTNYKEVDRCVACDEYDADIDGDTGLCPSCKESYFDKIDEWIKENTQGDITEEVLLNILYQYVDEH